MIFSAVEAVTRWQPILYFESEKATAIWCTSSFCIQASNSSHFGHFTSSPVCSLTLMFILFHIAPRSLLVVVGIAAGRWHMNLAMGALEGPALLVAFAAAALAVQAELLVALAGEPL